jgi:hypothetical protein
MMTIIRNVQHRFIDEYGAVSGMSIESGECSTREKPAPVTLVYHKSQKT